MAKKATTVTTEQNSDTGQTDTSPEVVSIPVTTATGSPMASPTSDETDPPTEPLEGEGDPDNKPEPDPEPDPEPEPEPEPRFDSQVTDKVLSVFSNYDELYVDTHGGSFVVDTDGRFLKTATLYTNPYHKP